MTLDEAKKMVTDMLTIGTPDEVFLALTKSYDTAHDLYPVGPEREEAQADYGLLRLALADLTGNAAYRL
jgi:hypothetical protein